MPEMRRYDLTAAAWTEIAGPNERYALQLQGEDQTERWQGGGVLLAWGGDSSPALDAPAFVYSRRNADRALFSQWTLAGGERLWARAMSEPVSLVVGVTACDGSLF